MATTKHSRRSLAIPGADSSSVTSNDMTFSNMNARTLYPVVSGEL
jgi:hypothetical protein